MRKRQFIKLVKEKWSKSKNFEEEFQYRGLIFSIDIHYLYDIKYLFLFVEDQDEEIVCDLKTCWTEKDGFYIEQTKVSEEEYWDQVTSLLN